MKQYEFSINLCFQTYSLREKKKKRRQLHILREILWERNLEYQNETNSSCGQREFPGEKFNF